ncbi:MAG TPA: proline dehydrogenase family protein, partial [Rhizomicrobium sp.]
MTSSSPLRDAISAAYLADEEAVVDRRIAQAALSPAEAEATRRMAVELVARIRKDGGRHGGVDAFMREYALSSEEGVALMCLAEALLRVPDADTADRLIRDKIGGAQWDRHRAKSDSLFVNASTWALMLTGRIVRLDDTAKWDFDGIFRRLVSRTGEPVIRQAVTYAMRILGRQFVLGRTIPEALKEAKPLAEKGYRFSFDMLGEAAYTKADAARYAQSYRDALESVAAAKPKDARTILGHAYLVSVGYMDPGNWATDLAGGSKFGYTLIWVLLMSNLMALLLQGLSARLGIVRGRDLAQANRE